MTVGRLLKHIVDILYFKAENYNISVKSMHRCLYLHLVDKNRLVASVL